MRGRRASVSLTAMRKHAIATLSGLASAFLLACSGGGTGNEAGERPTAPAPVDDNGNAPAAPSDGTPETNDSKPPAPASRSSYLAIGDSIAFGYNLNHRTYFPDGSSKDVAEQTANAVGYPEALEKVLAHDFKVRSEERRVGKGRRSGGA